MKHLSHPNLVTNARWRACLAFCGTATTSEEMDGSGEDCAECHAIDAELRLSGSVPALCWLCGGTGNFSHTSSSATLCPQCAGGKWYRAAMPR